MKFLVFAVFVCLTQIIQFSFADNCRKYDVNAKFENANNNQIAAVDTNPKNPPQILLNDKCQLYVKGCLTIKAPIISAKLSFKVKKDGKLDLLKEDDIDLCEVLKQSRYPTGCPLLKPPTARICDDFRFLVDLSKYEDLLPKLVGELHVDAVIETNDKDKSYFKIVVSVAEKK